MSLCKWVSCVNSVLLCKWVWCLCKFSADYFHSSFSPLGLLRASPGVQVLSPVSPHASVPAGVGDPMDTLSPALHCVGLRRSRLQQVQDKSLATEGSQSRAAPCPHSTSCPSEGSTQGWELRPPPPHCSLFPVTVWKAWLLACCLNYHFTLTSTLKIWWQSMLIPTLALGLPQFILQRAFICGWLGSPFLSFRRADFPTENPLKPAVWPIHLLGPKLGS